jgi:hypothetical protein
MILVIARSAATTLVRLLRKLTPLRAGGVMGFASS